MRIWLRDLRKEKGLTMKTVANVIGISEGYYCSIENGDKQKRMDTSVILGLANCYQGICPGGKVRNRTEYDGRCH